MKIYSIPCDLKTIIFDIDSTLYTCPEYAYEQVDCQIRRYCDLNGLTHDQGRKLIEDFRTRYSQEHDGKKISLGNALTHFGISIEQSVQWRNELMDPAKFLHHDEQMIQALTKLKEKYSLICVTNNPVLPARKTLEVIGISELIPQIIGLDTCFKSKPAREPFELAANKTGAQFNQCLSVGDRYDMDLGLAMELGMGGILVDGAEDVYTLPDILK